MTQVVHLWGTPASRSHYRLWCLDAFEAKPAWLDDIRGARRANERRRAGPAT